MRLRSSARRPPGAEVQERVGLVVREVEEAAGQLGADQGPDRRRDKAGCREWQEARHQVGARCQHQRRDRDQEAGQGVPAVHVDAEHPLRGRGVPG
jgi:hypothetical protein